VVREIVHKMTRPTGLTDKVIPVLCMFVREGAPFKNAFFLSGFTDKVGEYWRTQGRKHDEADEDTVYSRMFSAMNKARAEFLHSQVRNVIKAGEKTESWQAAMRILESADPDSYSKYAKAREIEGFTNDKSIKELMSLIIDLIGNAKIPIEEGGKHVAMLAQMVKIEENTELREIIERLEAELKIAKGE